MRSAGVGHSDISRLRQSASYTSKQTNLRSAIGLTLAGIPIVCAVLANSFPETLAWINLSLLLVVIIIAVRSAHGLDKTHPLIWLATALAIMYVMHPLAYIANGGFNTYYHTRLLTEPGYGRAMLLAVVASTAVILGWLLASQLKSRSSAAQRARTYLIARGSSQQIARTALTFSWVLIVFALVGFSIFAVTSGQNPVDAILNGAKRGTNTNSSAYLYLTPQAIGPATLLRAYANNALQRSQRSVYILAIVQAFLYIPTGQRLVLVLTLIPTILFIAHVKKFRLGLIGTSLAILALLLSLVVLRDAGSAQGTTLAQSLQSSLANPGRALAEFATGADTEMIDGLSVEVQRVPVEIPHQPGLTALSSLASPVPSVIWPGKPVTADSILNSKILGTERNFASVAYGFAGELYFDSGAPGVFAGFFIFSIVCFMLWEYRRRYLTSDLHMTLYFTLLPLIVIHLRGSLALTLGRMLFIVGPVLVMLYLARGAGAVDSGPKSASAS